MSADSLAGRDPVDLPGGTRRVTFAVDRGPIATIRCCPVLYDATMIFDEARQLVEADRHICDAHRAIQHQRKTVAELKASGKPSHAANALLALMILMLPIVEDLRQQISRVLASN